MGRGREVLRCVDGAVASSNNTSQRRVARRSKGSGHASGCKQCSRRRKSRWVLRAAKERMSRSDRRVEVDSRFGRIEKKGHCDGVGFDEEADSSLFARRLPFVVGAMISSCCGKNAARLPTLPLIAAKVGTLGRLRSALRDLKCSCLRRCQSRI